MKKYFLALLSFFVFLSSVFCQSQVLLQDKKIDSLLHTKKLTDENGRKISIYETYRCKQPYISDASKGIYFVFSNIPALKDNEEKISSPLVYVQTNDNNRIIDLLNVSNRRLLLPVWDPKTTYGFDYIKFDNYGRAFFSAINTVSQHSGIAVYNPESATTIFYPLPRNDYAVIDFEITEDGRYFLVHSGQKNNGKLPDKHNIYIYDSKNVNSAQPLFEFNKDRISQIQYNTSDKCFYFIAYYEADDELTGTYVLFPKDGEYTVDGLIRYPNEGNLNLDFSNAVLVKDNSNQKLYASFYSDWNESMVYELTRYENRINFSVPYNLDTILLKSKAKEKLLNQNIQGITFVDINGKYFSLLDERLTSYRNENDYQDKLSSEMLKAGEFSSNLEYMNFRLKSNNIILFIVASILFAALFVLLILNIREIRKKRAGLEQKQIRQIQENEKARISREIHDTIVQDLRAVRVQAENLESSDNDNKNSLIVEITKCIVKLRNICYSLTPAELDTGKNGDGKTELVSIIDTLCRQFNTKTNIPCSVQVEENFDFPIFDKDKSTNIIRVFQEILNNIEKHSYATKVSVLIRSKIEDNKKHFIVFVIDDGVGCDLEEIEKNKGNTHFGIRNMKDRMNQIGARIEFFSMPEQGMKVKMIVEI